MKLIEHRQNLLDNPRIYREEVVNPDRLIKTLIPHLNQIGLKITLKKNSDDLELFIRLIFNTQDNRPLLFVQNKDNPLPLCWNSPQNWKYNYIRYEWGHLNSKNQTQEKAHNIENLGLYSARGNQHLQSSLNINELKEALGGAIENRIISVIKRREELFKSNEWLLLISRLKN